MIRAFIVASFVALMPLAPAALAAESGTKDEAVAMVKRVLERIKTDGAEATFKAISDPSITEFHEGNLDPFVLDLNGMLLAGATRSAIGKNLLDVKNADEKYPVRMMIELAKGPGNGWLEYKWLNPRTKIQQKKATYIEKIDTYIVGAGIYSD